MWRQVIDVEIQHASAPSSEHIRLKVMTEDGKEIYIKSKPDKSLKKLMQTFCNRQGVTMNDVYFKFDGERIQPAQTPAELGMEDGDSIHVFLR